jgi:hypothetical protein
MRQKIRATKRHKSVGRGVTPDLLRQLTELGLPAAGGLFDQRNQLSAHQIIKTSVSAAAITTSAGLIFVLSWVGLALLGF